MFETRIAIKDKVYLLAEEAASALGYSSTAAFRAEYKNLIMKAEGLPEMISEEDYNYCLSGNPDAYSRLRHIEMTHVRTLRAETESEVAIYPLKLMMAEDWFRARAVAAGCISIQEYIYEFDYPEMVESRISELREIESFPERYFEELRYYNDPDRFDKDMMSESGLQIQYYTEIKGGRAALNAFLAGKGIFHEIHADDEYYYDEMRVVNGELIIPDYDLGEGKIVDVNYGADNSGRDYREHTALENILFLLCNRRILDAGVDLLECSEPGINAYISCDVAFRLLNPNMFKELILIDGVADIEQIDIVTSPKN